MPCRCECCESPFLRLDRYHRVYELSVNLRFSELKAIEIGRERFKFSAADCEAKIQELGSVDWHNIFSRKSLDQCTDLFYDVICSCFVSLVPKTSPHCVQKFPWVTKELNGLKNRATTAAKRMKKASGCK
jgi:hypothetical protein